MEKHLISQFKLVSIEKFVFKFISSVNYNKLLVQFTFGVCDR